jgi:hypothetical protein
MKKKFELPEISIYSIEADVIVTSMPIIDDDNVDNDDSWEDLNQTV